MAPCIFRMHMSLSPSHLPNSLRFLIVQMILDTIEQVGGIYVVTADHGNAEDMVKRNKKGEPDLDKDGNIQILTSHTLEPVSVLLLMKFCWLSIYEMAVIKAFGLLFTSCMHHMR